jgi:hypothetical protein
MRKNILVAGATFALLGVLIGGLASRAVVTSHAAGSVGKSDLGARVQRLEDREEIRKLFNDYGRTLDQRNFAGFEDLFAEDSEYVGGGAMGTLRGPRAIRAALESQMAANPAHLNSPNFHLFFNESIDVDGDRGTAISKSAFVVRSDGNKPDMVFLASYDDVLIREKGKWKFQRRLVHGDIPAPPNSTNR